MIEAHDLTKTCGSKTAVADLSFTVRPGIVTGFLGPFGLLLVAPTLGLLPPSSWRDALLPYLPNYAGSAVTTVRPQHDLLPAPVGALVLLAWAVLPLIAAAVLLRRRDA